MVCPRIWKQYLKNLSTYILLKSWICKTKSKLLFFQECMILVKDGCKNSHALNLYIYVM